MCFFLRIAAVNGRAAFVGFFGFVFVFLLFFFFVFFLFFGFFCVPKLYFWGSPLLGEIFAYVTVF